MDKPAFERLIKTTPLPLLVEFRADWCAPCRAMQPVLDAAKQQYSGQVQIVQVDADTSPELLRSLGVMAIPTLLYYRNGVQVGRHTGAIHAAALERQMAQLLAGGEVQKPPLSLLDRALRLGTGLVLAAIGFSGEHTPWLVALGGVIAFTAVYDRCPIYRAVSAQVRRWLGRLRKTA